jgi:HNH endonuclease
MSPAKYTCIYCLRSLSRTRFNREHVMPQHLGTFRENMVLHDAVCRECNSSLGSLLERWLGRDSFEALQRWRFGQKPPAEFGKFQGRGVRLRLPPGTAWEGTILTIWADDETDELVVYSTPQIGVKRLRESEFHFFTEDEFNKAPDEAVGTEDGSTFKIIGLGPNGLEQIIETVRRRVPNLRIDGTMPSLPPSSGDALVVVMTNINALIARAIAKISFSYMTYFAGTDFALHEAFNQVRLFIRYGEGVPQDFVKVSTRPVLANDALWYGSVRGHLVTVEWPGTADCIFSKIALFNELSYIVTLTRRCSAIWRPIQYGNLFDWETGEIKELTIAAGLSLPWQMVKP